MSEQQSERRHVAIFLIACFILTWALMGYVIAVGGIRKAGLLILLVMWIPGLTSLLYRFIAKLGFHDVGWRIGGFGFWLMAILVPLFAAVASYGANWLAGISEFSQVDPMLLARNGVQTPFELFWKVYPVAFLVGCFAALGEEIGWRGFLIPRLYKTGIRYPLLVSGLIWGVWHFPLILWGGYATSALPVVSVLLFTVMISIAGIFVGWLRMVSGSVWVAMAYHAAHNLFFQTAFEVFNRPGPLWPYFGGESGVFPCLALGLIVTGGYLVIRNRRSAIPA